MLSAPLLIFVLLAIATVRYLFADVAARRGSLASRAQAKSAAGERRA